MSEEREVHIKKDPETETDDVDAHVKLRPATEDPGLDDDNDVEAHVKNKL